MTTDLTPVNPAPPPALPAPSELTIDQLVARVAKVRDAIRSVCVVGADIVKIPGVEKPVATKSFAEKLSLLFMFAPTFVVSEERDGDHLECVVTCTLTHAPTGVVVGSCVGSCSTRESKYRYRNADRSCPSCGKAAIIKGKADYGGGWLCFAKKGGCGAKFADADQSIVGQVTGRVENPDIADTWNTVRKMAQKRAYVGAVLLASGASDVVTQDLDDFAPAETERERETVAQPAARPAPAASAEGSYVAQVLGVETKTGINAKTKQPWTRYGVKLRREDGSEIVAGTFSDTDGPAAQSAAATQMFARVVVEARGQYLDLKSIEPAPASASDDVAF